MKKILLISFFILMTILFSGCSASDRQLIKDTVDLFDETTPPEISLITDIPTSIKIGESLDPHFTVKNSGGGVVKMYVNMYKNDESIVKYGQSFSMVIKGRNNGTGNLPVFDFVNNATYETADVKVDFKKGFSSSGVYKYEFVFYNCADLKNKLDAGDNCNNFSVDQKHQSGFGSKGVEPIKIETYQVVVSQ